MDVKKIILICIGILVFAGVITLLIFYTEPEAQQEGAQRQTAMLVDVVEAEQGDYRPTIRAMGTVRPSKDINLSPRVSGEIIERSDAFTPGGYVEKGEKLLQIDPADYENVLEQRRSELRQAQADLDIEMGQQVVAQQDYQLFADTVLSEKKKSLILREPQLESAKSSVESARAALKQARLDLERTSVEAPFNAHILSRNVNVGSQVSEGENLGRLVGLDTYWVEATVPVSKLQWISLPGDEESGADVRVRNRTAWPENAYREGQLFKLVGTLEDQTRMARVLVTVPDPQAYQADDPGVPRLMLGSFVEVNIEADELTDVIRLNRDYIRDENTVWIMEDEELRIASVDVLFEDAEYAYIKSGVEEDDQIVTTNLSTVSEGAPLRLEESEENQQE